jgi:hypothetical protein
MLGSGGRSPIVTGRADPHSCQVTVFGRSRNDIGVLGKT